MQGKYEWTLTTRSTDFNPVEASESMAARALYRFSVFLTLAAIACAKGGSSSYYPYYDDDYYSSYGDKDTIASGEPVTENTTDDNGAQEPVGCVLPTGVIDAPSLTYESALLELRCHLACADMHRQNNSTVIEVATA